MNILRIALGLAGSVGLIIAIWGAWTAAHANPVIGTDVMNNLEVTGASNVTLARAKFRRGMMMIAVGFGLQLVSSLSWFLLP